MCVSYAGACLSMAQSLQPGIAFGLLISRDPWGPIPALPLSRRLSVYACVCLALGSLTAGTLTN